MRYAPVGVLQHAGAIIMGSGYFRFMLGEFECACLLDGYVDYPVQNHYANIPREQVDVELRRRNLPVDVVTTPYTYLFVNTGRHRILVDMGAGTVMKSTGHLTHSLEAAGIEPASIDTVIISHAHPDHIGGTLDEHGAPIYSNATYYIGKDERDFWYSDLASTKTPVIFVKIARSNLDPLKERTVIVDGQCEVVPGVWLMPAPGHTPGHMVVEFRSGAHKLLYISDTVLQPLHLEEPGWLPIYDILPDKAAVSKHEVFDRAVKEHLLVLGQHFQPFPSLGYVEKQSTGWKWTPISIAAGAVCLTEFQTQTKQVIG